MLQVTDPTPPRRDEQVRDAQALWDSAEKDPRSLEPHWLDMAADDGRDDDEPSDLAPSVITTAIAVIVSVLVGIAAWHGANAVGWGL